MAEKEQAEEEQQVVAPAPETPEVAPPETFEAAPETAPEAVVEVTTEVAAEPPAFDISTWEGHVDDVPEHIRDVVVQTREWAEQRARSSLAEREAELDRLSQTYNDLIAASSDPRLKGLEEERKALAAQLEDVKTRFNAAQSELTAAQANFEQHKRDMAERERDRFVAENSWIFDEGTNEALAGELVSEGWRPQDLPVIMKYGKSKLKKVREALAKSPQAHDAILSLIDATPEPKPTSSKELVGDAVEPASTGDIPPPPATKPTSRREQFVASAAKAMKRHSKK